MDYNIYPALSRVARGIDKAELVLKNGSILNVFTEEFITGDIAICGDIIVGVGSYSGIREIDVSGTYIVPGFIDSHLHLESTLVQPFELIEEALKFGTTTFIIDPHESANVAGTEGIDYILEQTGASPANVYVMIPSCVPSGESEDNGYLLEPEEMGKYLHNERILGLGEVMDCPSVINGNKTMMKKLDLFQSKIMDGHAPSLNDKELTAYALAGIKTDHECCDYEYAKKECQNGIHVLIREGSGAKNLEAIVSGILKEDASTERYCFCTDDKHIEDIKREGHISYNVKKSIALGLPPIKALKMASFHAANCYHLNHLGAIAPGYQADLVLLRDLDTVEVSGVYHKGKKIEEYQGRKQIPIRDSVMNTIHVEDFHKEKLKLPISTEGFPVIQIISGQIITKKLVEKVPVQDGIFTANQIYNKIAVIERHKKTGKVGVGVLKGFGIKNGAVASSVSHDSHNIIVVGDNDRDMEAAVNELIEKQGGYTVAAGGEIIETLALPVMGLISDAGYREVEEKLKRMIAEVRAREVNPDMDPFITLSFMALTVLPEIRISTRGIFEIGEEKN